jgi:hypothetical protein
LQNIVKGTIIPKEEKSEYQSLDNNGVTPPSKANTPGLPKENIF